METVFGIIAIVSIVLIVVIIVFPIIAQLLFVAVMWIFSKIIQFSVYLAKRRGQGGLD